MPQGAPPVPASPEQQNEGGCQRRLQAMMTGKQLQAKYLEVVGRPTGSSDRAYLIWKLREAEKGRSPVDPRSLSE